MKTIYTILSTILMTFAASFAQCTVVASGFGNNTSTAMYNITGMVSVVLNSNTSVSVKLAPSFATASGPNVRVYLVNRGSLTDAMLKVPSNFLSAPKIEMGMITANGMATYTKPIPAGMNISDFNTVYFFCASFNQFWDFGSITPFNSNNCVLLGNSYFEKNSFSVYPNPVNEVLNLDLSSFEKEAKINVYTILGSLIVSKNKSSLIDNQLNVNELAKGIYLLEILDSENNRFTKKIIKN